MTDGVGGEHAGGPAGAMGDMRPRLAAGHASDVVLKGSDESVIEWVSPSAAALFGWAPDALVGRPFAEFIHADDGQRVRAAESDLPEGIAAAFDARFRTSTGDYRWTSFVVRPILDRQGAVVGRAAGLRDAQTQVEAEQARRRLEREMKALATGAGAILMRISAADHSISSVSDDVTGAIGWRPAELIGRHATELWHPDDLAEQAEGFRRVLAGETVATRGRLRGKDGTYRWFVVTGLLSEDAGAPSELVVVFRDIDDQARLQEDLERRERLLRAVSDSVLDPQILVRAVRDAGGAPVDFVYEDVNRASTEYMSLGREQLIGASVLASSPGMQEAGLIELYAGAVDSGEPIHVEDYLYTSATHGDMRRYDIRVVPLGDDELSITWRDVTRRYEAAARLAAAEQHFRSLYETMQQGVVFHDAEGRITAANPAAERILGLTLDQLQGRTSSDPRWRAVREDGSDFPGEEHPAMAALRSKRRVEGVQMGVRHPAEDATRWLLIDAVPQFRAGDETPYQVFTVFTDVTELREAEAALRESEDRFHYTFDNSLVGNAITAPDGRIVAVNDALARMLGYAREELVGADNRLVTFPEDDAAMRERAADMATGASKEVRARRRFRTRDGSARWGDVTSSLRRDADGRPMYFIGSVVDMTDEVTAEAELRERSAELERTAARLHDANAELEAFSYSVSHDLRAPLRAVDGFSQILADDYGDVLDDAGKTNLQRIRTGAQRMNRLIDDLLALSRVGRTELQLDAVDVSAMAAATVEDLRAAAPERRVQVAVRPGLTAVADRGLVRVLLTNLLGNAWKFTAQQAEAHIEVGARDEDGGTVFFVRDDGIGFDQEHAEDVFTPFTRLDPQAGFAGSGIGLATVRRIVARHGGRCWAQGAPGEGATFFFTLGDPAGAT